MKSLSDDLYERIRTLCKEGDRLVNANDIVGGLREYNHAWKLLPEPKEEWEAATWVLSAIGDAHYSAGDFKNAVSALSNALQCPDGLGNPFIHLRLGESCLELGDSQRAQDELTRAYMGGGKDIFDKENPKYFAFLKSFLMLPPGKDTF